MTSARTGALAIDLWPQHRSTNQQTSVQISDARDEVAKAYKGIAELKAEDPVDIGRQRMLTQSMTDIIGQLNAASATLRTITTEPRVQGLVISPRTKSSYLGYERTDANAPLMVAALMRWRHRGTFLAEWEDVARVGSDVLTLSSGFTRQPAALRGKAR